MGSLTGRVAVITGAGRGLGRAHALRFAAEGAQVVVNDPGVAPDGSGGDASPAQSVVDEITAQGGEAVANTDSVTDWQGARRIVDAAVAAFGDLHVVVNNAGIIRNRALVAMAEKEFDDVVAVHLKGTFAVTHWAARHWREAPASQVRADRAVINTTSGSGLLSPLPAQANYAAAKAGVAAMTTVAALELSRYGVRVNCVSPSMARTRLTETVPGVAPARDDDQFDPFDPRNVSAVYAYLATAGCPFNGEVFTVRGASVIAHQGWSAGEAVHGTGPWAVEELGRAMAVLPRRDPLASLAAALGGALDADDHASLQRLIDQFLAA